MEELIDILIDDYNRRLSTARSEIQKNFGKMKCSRLQTKASCYRTFIAELEKIKRAINSSSGEALTLGNNEQLQKDFKCIKCGRLFVFEMNYLDHLRLAHKE